MLTKDKINRLQKILRLQDWDIDYIEVPTMQNSAGTKTLYNEYRAVIEMKAELSEEEKEVTLIHEMLHLVYRDAYDIFTEQCQDEFAKDYCTKQHERAIEKTAKIIYSLMKGEIHNAEKT